MSLNVKVLKYGDRCRKILTRVYAPIDRRIVYVYYSESSQSVWLFAPGAHCKPLISARFRFSRGWLSRRAERIHITGASIGNGPMGHKRPAHPHTSIFQPAVQYDWSNAPSVPYNMPLSLYKMNKLPKKHWLNL